MILVKFRPLCDEAEVSISKPRLHCSSFDALMWDTQWTAQILLFKLLQMIRKRCQIMTLLPLVLHVCEVLTGQKYNSFQLLTLYLPTYLRWMQGCSGWWRCSLRQLLQAILPGIQTPLNCHINTTHKHAITTACTTTLRPLPTTQNTYELTQPFTKKPKHFPNLEK